MKNCYFTDENIESKALKFKQELQEQLRIKSWDYKPEKSALLIIDMQNFFVDPTSHAFVPSSKAIIPKIQTLAAKFNENNLPVICSRHINNPDNKDLMGKWWKDKIRQESKESEITKAFANLKYKELKKTQYDCFYNTDLAEYLKQLGIKQLVITGVMAHLCCETTARSAFVRGFEPIFTIDATATYNEIFHKATLLNIAHGFGTPCLVDELLKEMK